MSATSPTYNCTTADAPKVDTQSPYCLLPGGAPRMEICCSQVGNGTVNFIPDCYSWCNVNLAHAVYDTDPQRLWQLSEMLTDCLQSGVNRTISVSGMSCGLGDGKAIVSPDKTSPIDSSPGMSTSQATRIIKIGDNVKFATGMWMAIAAYAVLTWT
ncbi:hypothetical protein NU195Hw_g8526t1 [Hortaea werneckii]